MHDFLWQTLQQQGQQNKFGTLVFSECRQIKKATIKASKWSFQDGGKVYWYILPLSVVVHFP